MEIFWRHTSLTVREAYRILGSQRDIAYTTVLTVITRLANKKLLAKTKGTSAFIYSAVFSRNEFMQSTTRRVLSSLAEDLASPVLSQFLDSVHAIDPKMLDELARLIEKKRKDSNV